MTDLELVAAIDVGSSKVVCLVACEDENGGQRILGAGQQASRGVLSGTVVNMEAAEHSVASAVTRAEEFAGETLRRVWVSVSGGQPRSDTVSVDVSIAGHEVGDADLRRVVHKTRQAAHHPSRELLHAIPVGYAIDGSHGIRDPRGMVGERLGVRVHLVSSERGPVANLETCIGRCHLDITGHAASACAAALGCLVEDEMEMGVTVIDFGGGTTDLAMFMEGECVHVDSIPVGGQHITSDIAEALSTPAETAERIKTLHGSVLSFESDNHETFEIPLIGERDGAVRVITQAELTAIIRPRVEHMLQMLKHRLGAEEFAQQAARRLVLTGGGSQFQGLGELAARHLGRQVRPGHPIWLKGLDRRISGPAFTACAGLLRYAARGGELGRSEFSNWHARRGPFDRLGQWLRLAS